VKDYTVYLERVFRGPMDLLLHLVREQEVEIHEIEITKVIEGYMGYLEALTDLDIEVAGEFAVMAATLMAIKSRSLLPREEIDLEDELDPKDELIQRLLEYRRFKEASDRLARGLEMRSQLHPRGSFPELAEERSADEPVLDLGDLSSWDLLSSFSRLMRETLANQPVHIAGEARPMRYYVLSLARNVQRAGRLSLANLIASLEGETTRETVVGAFCALLELVKIGVVRAEQGDRSGEIDVILAASVEGNVEALLDGTTFDDELSAQVLAETGEEAKNPAGEVREDGAS
jgi:segregation and condensation protein A